MKECRLCKRPLRQEDAVCAHCGYDPTTDIISPSFKPKGEIDTAPKKASPERRGISSGVRKFAVIGLLIVMFSIFFRHNFNINGIIYEAKLIIDRITGGKFINMNMFNSKENKEVRQLKLTDVSSYAAVQKNIRYNDLVIKGIFFDPQAKSMVNINGKMISEGDIFEGITVKKINRDSVELLINGEVQALSVGKKIHLPKK